MIIQNSLSRIFGPRPKPVDETVTFENQHLKSRYLGTIPRDYHSYSSYGEGYVSGSSDRGVGVYRNTPVYEPDGQPRVDVVTERLQEKAYSVPLFGAMGAAGGGAVGFGVGALVGHLAGFSPVLGGSVVGGIAGLATAWVAADYAAKDRVRLEWREQPINEKRMDGYYHDVSPHYVQRCRTETDKDGKSTQHCWQEQDGYNHRFRPDVKYWKVGSQVAPTVVHYQDGSWKPEPTPSDTDTADPNVPITTRPPSVSVPE